MLIYVKIIKLSKNLDILQVDACSTQPINIFEFEQKVCTLEQSIEFQNLCKQALPTEELHVQQGKHSPHLQCILHFFFLISHMQSCSQVFNRISNFKLFDVPQNF